MANNEEGKSDQSSLGDDQMEDLSEGCKELLVSSSKGEGMANRLCLPV